MTDHKLVLGERYDPDIVDPDATRLYEDERSTYSRTSDGEVIGFVQCGPPHTIPFPELDRPLGTFVSIPDRLIWKPFPDKGAAGEDALSPFAEELSKAPWHLMIRRVSGVYEYVGQAKSGGVGSGGHGLHLWCSLSANVSRELWLETTGQREWLLNLTGWYFQGNLEEATHYAETARNPLALWSRSPEEWQQTLTWFTLGARNYAGDAAIWLSTTHGDAASLSMELDGEQWVSTNRSDGHFEADKRCMMGDEYNVACDSIVDVETAIHLFRAFLKTRSTVGWYRLGTSKPVKW